MIELHLRPIDWQIAGWVILYVVQVGWFIWLDWWTDQSPLTRSRLALTLLVSLLPVMCLLLAIVTVLQLMERGAWKEWWDKPVIKRRSK